MDEYLLPVEAFPDYARRRITQLNDVLFPGPYSGTSKTGGRMGRRRLANSHKLKPQSKAAEIQSTWRAYVLCRSTLQRHLDLIPRRAWNALWNKLAEEGDTNPDRLGHIKYLGDDMRAAGVVLSPARHLLYIEALYIDDDRNLAFKEWEDLKEYSAEKTDHHIERAHHHTKKRSFQLSYWELGVRMFSLDGKPDRAFEAAEGLFKVSQSPAAFRCLLPIIRAYLVKDKEFCQRAWALYVQMRLKLGSEITMEDYDNVILSFMNANEPYLALGVFKDMMITGDASLADRDSVASYKKVAGRETPLRLEISAAELGWGDSKLLGSLPARYNNKFFFGKWIKKLIGDGELDLAKKVFDLMEDRGIRSSPVHLNGLIGAWFRDGSEKYRSWAEDTAWKMIKARTDFVADRESWAGLESPVRAIESKDLTAIKDISFTPYATIETFNILIQQYRQRQRHDLASALFEASVKAQVKPNTAFLNELMLLGTRNHTANSAWATYYSMTSTSHVRPDFETFIILWNLEKRALDPVVGRREQNDEREDFPDCRQLFANMMEHIPSQRLRVQIPKELYDLIILSFSLAQDQVGTAVALRALKRYYNGMPRQDTARTIVLQLARLGSTSTAGQSQRMSGSLMMEQRIARVMEILDRFKNQRIEALKARGITFEHMNDIAKIEETELLLSDLLRYAASNRLTGKEKKDYNAAKASRIAAEQMGVPDCALWDHGTT